MKKSDSQDSQKVSDLLKKLQASYLGKEEKLVKKKKAQSDEDDRKFREKLAAMCVDTREPSAAYFTREEEAAVEITPLEQQTTHKYEQMDLDAILDTAPRATHE